MGCRLLCDVALCLLGAGPKDTGIPQTPKYLVTAKGSKRTLKCEQHLGHDSMYWYRQKAEKSLEFMFYYNYKALTEIKTVPNHLTPERPDSSCWCLHAVVVQLEDSAVCLCTSSQDTALQSHRLPVDKPPGSSQEAVGATHSSSLWPDFVLNEAVPELECRTGFTEPEVTQTPSHQVTRMGQEVILQCVPIPNHLNFFWYRHILGKKVEFLVYFYNDNISEKSEIFDDRFSVKRPDGTNFTLKIQSTKPEDSATYFCASSQATALQRHLQPVHKPSWTCFPLSCQHPLPA
ncbi:T cell receptor beta variable 2 [Plecturocebus cupreus]